MFENAGEIGKQLALVAAVAAAMQTFLAPTIHAQVEALQASRVVPSHHGGIAAGILGIVYGVCLGALGMLATESPNDWLLLLVGFLAGLVAGGGAVIADQRQDGLMARKLDRADVTQPQVLTVDEATAASDKVAAQGGHEPNGAKPAEDPSGSEVIAATS